MTDAPGGEADGRPLHRLGRALLRRIGAWVSPEAWRKQAVFAVGALLVAVVAVGFAAAANVSQALFRDMLAIHPALPLAVTPALFALCAWIMLRVLPGSGGSGIPQAIAAHETTDLDLRHRLLSLRIAAGKIALTLIGLLGGAAIGREGPTVQVGAAIMLATGRLAKLHREPALVLAGAAAGISAAFNAPLAGIVFAIEEMARSYESRGNALVLTAVIVGGIAVYAMIGNYTYFGTSTAAMPDGVAWAAIAVCGVAGGLAGGAFSRSVIAVADRMAAPSGTGWTGWIARRPVTFAALCGLALALLGLASGGAAYGTGYDVARAAIEGGDIAWWYGPVKWLASLLSAASGIPGGLFAPALSTGAGIGHGLWTALPLAPLATMALLGMVGYFAGVVQSPMTAFVIVLEMTADRDMMVPLMATAVIAYAASRTVCPEPVYHALARHFRQAPASREAGPA